MFIDPKRDISYAKTQAMASLNSSTTHSPNKSKFPQSLEDEW